MKKHAKLLVLVLSLALIIGAIAIVASADNGNVAIIGETEYATLEQAITAAQDNEVVKLIANAEVAESITINKSITINLNGKTLTAPHQTFKVANSVEFSITGEGTINVAGAIIHSDAKTAAPTASIVGTGTGIKVVQKVATKESIVAVQAGTFNFKNVIFDLDVKNDASAFAVGDAATLNFDCCQIYEWKSNNTNSDRLIWVGSGMAAKINFLNSYIEYGPRFFYSSNTIPETQLNLENTTVVYKLGYVMSQGVASAVTFDVWFGEENGALNKLLPTVANGELCAYDQANDTLTVSSNAFSSAQNMTPLDIVLVSLGALNGDCDWTVSKIEKLAVAPGADVEGYNNPVNTNAAEVKITEAQTYVGTTDSIVKAVENINENYVAITMKHTQNPSYYAMGINLLGTTENGWSAGLVLALTQDGHCFRVGGVNNPNLVQLNFYSMGNGAEMTVAYQLKYLETKGKVTKVQITLWQGPAGGQLVKVAPHGDVTQGDGWSYDAEYGCFFFDYNIVTEDQFAPDCTLIAMGAFNDKDVDCDWTVTKVEVAAEKPKALASVINGLNQNVTIGANTDAHAQAVANLSDEYVTIACRLRAQAGGAVCRTAHSSHGSAGSSNFRPSH